MYNATLVHSTAHCTGVVQGTRKMNYDKKNNIYLIILNNAPSDRKVHSNLSGTLLCCVYTRLLLYSSQVNIYKTKTIDELSIDR